MGGTLTADAAAWSRRGTIERFRDRDVHVFRRPGPGRLLCLLHGYPTCSFDFEALIDALPAEANVLAFDFLGFGLSDKPADHTYTLAWQADLTEELVRRHGDGSAAIIAHDMGTSVATELMARGLDGSPAIEIESVLLFNGSVVIEAASLTPSQKLLLSPVGFLGGLLSNPVAFRAQFGRLFSDAHPLSRGAADDHWSLIAHKGGHRKLHRLIHYVHERTELADRWHGAVRDWPGELRLAWGLEDPVATTNVLGALTELRPSAPVEELPGLGHYPQLEDPEAVAAVVAKSAGSA